MIYLVLKKTSNPEARQVCLVAADSKWKAFEIVRVKPETTEWAAFTDDEVSAIRHTEEGYITAPM